MHFYMYPHSGVRRNPAGSEGTQWGPVKLKCTSVCPSLCLVVSLSGHPRRFLEIIHTDRNFVQHMWPQATGSNTLSVSVISPSIRLSVHMSVRLSVCLYVFPSVCLPIRLPVRLPIRPSICPSVCHPYVCPSVRPSGWSSLGLWRFLYLYSFLVWGSSVAMHFTVSQSFILGIIIFIHVLYVF